MNSLTVTCHYQLDESEGLIVTQKLMYLLGSRIEGTHSLEKSLEKSLSIGFIQ